MKPIEKLWEGYRKMVIPKDAPDIQIRECKQAFFAGAAAFLAASNECLWDSGDEPTEADLGRMAEIQAELDEFGQQFDRRYLSTKHDH